MKRTTKIGVYGLAVAALLGTTLAETSMAGKRGKKRPAKAARSVKDIGGHLQVQNTGIHKGPKKRPVLSSRSRQDVGGHLMVQNTGIRKAPKRTSGKRGKKRPKKSVLGFPFSLRRKAR